MNTLKPRSWVNSVMCSGFGFSISMWRVSFTDTWMLWGRIECAFSFYGNSVAHFCPKYWIPPSCKERTYVVHGYSIIFGQDHWHGVHKAGKLEFIWVLPVNMVTQNLGGSFVFLILEGTRRYPANAFQPLKISLVQILKFQVTHVSIYPQRDRSVCSAIWYQHDCNT